MSRAVGLESRKRPVRSARVRRVSDRATHTLDGLCWGSRRPSSSSARPTVRRRRHCDIWMPLILASVLSGSAGASATRSSPPRQQIASVPRGSATTAPDWERPGSDGMRAPAGDLGGMKDPTTCTCHWTSSPAPKEELCSGSPCAGPVRPTSRVALWEDDDHHMSTWIKFGLLVSLVIVSSVVSVVGWWRRRVEATHKP